MNRPVQIYLLHWLLLMCITQAILLNASRAIAVESTADGDERVSLSLQQADIKHLVQWAATYIDKTIIVHPSVKGNITVIAGEAIPAGEVERIFRSILQVYGFAVVESADSIKIIPDTLSSASDTQNINTQTGPGNQDIVTRVLPVEHGSAEEIATKLKPFLSGAAKIAVFPQPNLLLITDRYKAIQGLLDIVARIDQPHGYQVNVVQVRHAEANTIVQTINEILPKDRGDGMKALKLTADTRSNAILYSGDNQQGDSVQALIARLDRPLAFNSNTQVFHLNYSKATTLAPILSSIAEGIAQRSWAEGKPDAATIIETNEKQNAIVITASSETTEELKQVIFQLDQRRLQVLVEALIVEVNEEEAKDIGIEWKALLETEGGFAGNSSLSKNLPIPELPGLGPGLTLGFLRLDETSLLIRALEISGAANILSKPTIVALDNEEAEILVGENVPFITGSSTGSASSTDNPFQTITRQDIGITLKIRPQINRNGSITLDISQKVESLSDSVTSAADVVTNKREIQTHVLIEHDQILVLGGLIRDELQESTRKVPLLGDIPLLGRMFRGSSTQILKKNLMVFIHPRILANTEDSIAITNQHYGQISRNQAYINNKIDRFFVSQPPPDIRNEETWSSGADSSRQAP